MTLVNQWRERTIPLPKYLNGTPYTDLMHCLRRNIAQELK
ncbi:hypothetical protein ADIS_3729 [Lunatimonas lonarensis]|uniref:Uncharacterized protein n=1 Tax=Lunatimonas lonarensis TaxID=1232681 RepID=R7ZP53_9BACT|nr:hypothetical protein ADIS_3729 [Lunatimonas lonarensis]